MLRGLNLDSELRTSLQALEDALERAVARNTLIRLEVEVQSQRPGRGSQQSKEQGGHWEDWYFLNTVKGRQALALVRQGERKP